MRFSMADIGPMGVPNQNQTLGRTNPPAAQPRTQVKERSEDHAPSHRPQMSPTGLFLDGLLASIARLRFARHLQNNLDARRIIRWQLRLFLVSHEVHPIYLR